MSVSRLCSPFLFLSFLPIISILNFAYYSWHRTTLVLGDGCSQLSPNNFGLLLDENALKMLLGLKESITIVGLGFFRTSPDFTFHSRAEIEQ